MARHITFNVEAEARDLFVAFRIRGERTGATLRVPRSQASTLAAAILRANTDEDVGNYEAELFGDLTVNL
jgi:hypothetical protein